MKNIIALLIAFATAFTAFANTTPTMEVEPTPEVTVTAENYTNIDLIVKYIVKEKVQRVHGGYNVFLKAVVKNEGYYTLKRPFKVGFKFATSATQQPNEWLPTTVKLPYLGAKAAKTIHVCLFIPDGRLYGTNILGIQAEVDPQNYIYESNEHNNKSNTAICYLNGPS